ncbi:unnamed protein product [Sphagnum balticum]
MTRDDGTFPSSFLRIRVRCFQSNEVLLEEVLSYSQSHPLCLELVPAKEDSPEFLHFMLRLLWYCDTTFRNSRITTNGSDKWLAGFGTLSHMESTSCVPEKICKNLGFLQLDSDTIVYNQGDTGNIFYIVFTGSVRSITVVEGVQDDVISHCHPGQSFGVTGIELDDCIRESTYVTAERTELLMLSKQDYDNILMIQETPELKERVRFLKVFLQPSFHLWSTVAFKEVSKQSLRRLANVLSTRLFDKNRVVTFQGDDAVEMFFIKSGECRVIMEIQSGKNPSKLPRASSFLSQYWPTRHRLCKQEVIEREKDWGHPSIGSRRPSCPSTSGTRVSDPGCLAMAMGPMPSRLPAALMRSPDMLHQLVKRKCISSASQRSCEESVNTSIRQTSKRPISEPAPQHRSLSKRKSSMHLRPSARSEDQGPLSPWGPPKASSDGVLSGTRASRRSSLDPRNLPSASGMRPATMPTWKGSTNRCSNSAPAGSAHFKSPSLMKDRKTSSRLERRKSAGNKKYSLGSFLRDCDEKEKQQKKKDMDFTEKDHHLWQMGLLSQGQMPVLLVSDENVHYRQKFEKWARMVMNRERNLLSYNVFAGTVMPSFMPGVATSRVCKTIPNSLSTLAFGLSNGGQETSILDIGALHAGQFFGEKGLLTESIRAASIVAVTLVETLVLNKWDFFRHCDRDVIEALSKNEYTHSEGVYQQYEKSRKWELFKKHVVEQIVTAKKDRIYHRSGPRAVRFIPKAVTSKDGVVAREWM